MGSVLGVGGNVGAALLAVCAEDSHTLCEPTQLTAECECSSSSSRRVLLWWVAGGVKVRTHTL